MKTLPVTGVMPVQDPDRDDLQLTLDSLAQQSPAPRELIIVDASPGDPVTVGRRAFDVRVLHRPEWADRGRTIPLQRRTGVQAASQPVIWRLDEDAVFERADHLGALMADLDRPGVVATCSRVRPLRPTITGRLAASTMQLHPAYGLFPIWSTEDLRPEVAYPYDTTHPFSPRAEDVVFVNALMARGRIYRNDDLVAYTNLPMSRTKQAAGLAVAAVGAAFLGGG